MTGPAQFRCFFCGEILAETPGRSFRCPGCGARFAAQWDPDGCLVALQVTDCGTPDCCRNKQNPSS